MKKTILLLAVFALIATLAIAKTKYIAPEDLMPTMMGICKDLGVKCNHCHLSDKTVTLADTAKYDVEKDLGTLTQRRVARAMIGMQRSFTEKQGTKTTCVTCHQGQPHPPMKKK